MPSKKKVKRWLWALPIPNTSKGARISFGYFSEKEIGNSYPNITGIKLPWTEIEVEE